MLSPQCDFLEGPARIRRLSGRGAEILVSSIIERRGAGLAHCEGTIGAGTAPSPRFRHGRNWTERTRHAPRTDAAPPFTVAPPVDPEICDGLTGTRKIVDEHASDRICRDCCLVGSGENSAFAIQHWTGAPDEGHPRLVGRFHRHQHLRGSETPAAGHRARGDGPELPLRLPNARVLHRRPQPRPVPHRDRLPPLRPQSLSSSSHPHEFLKRRYLFKVRRVRRVPMSPLWSGRRRERITRAAESGATLGVLGETGSSEGASAPEDSVACGVVGEKSAIRSWMDVFSPYTQGDSQIPMESL